MSQSETKHVQTELTAEEYQAFRTLAEEEGMTVKEASREALVDWIDRQRRPDPEDPAFTVLDELERESHPKTAETDARTEGDLVEDWDGNDVEWTLADDPPGNQ